MSVLVAVDVDGTIHLDADFPGAESVRPNLNMLVVVDVLRAMGATVVLWSANGAGYAQMVAEAVGLTVDGFYPKPPTRPITTQSAEAILGEVPTLTIDDKPTETILGVPILRP